MTSALASTFALMPTSVLQAAASRPGDDQAGLLAFLVVAALALACVVIYRSLRGHLRKINFDEGPPAEAGGGRSAGSEPS